MKNEKEYTKLTVTINLDLSSLKKAYANYFGIDNYKTVLKSDIAEWVGNLAEADIESDLNQALEKFEV